MANYELETLWELRREARSETEGAYAAALSAYHLASREVEFARSDEEGGIEELRRWRARFNEALQKGTYGGALQSMKRHLEGVKMDLEEARERVRRAEEAESEARRTMRRAHEAMLAAVRELKAVEKHREKWAAEEARKEQRKATDQMDEVAARQWREGR